MKAINKTSGENSFSKEDEIMLQSFCDQIAGVLKNRSLEAVYTSTLDNEDDSVRQMLLQYTQFNNLDTRTYNRQKSESFDKPPLKDRKLSQLNIRNKFNGVGALPHVNKVTDSPTRRTSELIEYGSNSRTLSTAEALLHKRSPAVIPDGNTELSQLSPPIFVDRVLSPNLKKQRHVDVQDALARRIPVATWSFDVLGKTRSLLIGYSLVLFEDLGLIQRFNPSMSKLRCFLDRVEQSYTDTPYHNFHHGFSVLHTCCMVLTTTDASASLSSIDLFSMFIAAVCHDMGHRGFNNSFHNGMVYNDCVIPGIALRL